MSGPYRDAGNPGMSDSLRESGSTSPTAGPGGFQELKRFISFSFHPPGTREAL